MAEEPIKKRAKKHKVVEVEENGANAALAETETTPPFNPRAGLTDEQLALRDRLEELAMGYAQDDGERAWLSTFTRHVILWS